MVRDLTTKKRILLEHKSQEERVRIIETYGARYLGRQMLTQAELEKKLKDRFDLSYGEEIAAVINKFIEYGYLNDAYYGEVFVKQTKGLKPMGKALLKQNLKAKGLTDDVIKDSISLVTDEDYKTMIHTLIEKKWRTRRQGESIDKWKSKTWQFLMRKGFSYDQVRAGLASFDPGESLDSTDI